VEIRVFGKSLALATAAKGQSMPTIDQQTPLFSTLTSSYKYVYKSWTTTPNFKAVKSWDLPINAYNHTKKALGQTLWGGYITVNNTTGSVSSQYAGTFAAYGTTIDAKSHGFRTGSGYYDSVASLQNEALIKALTKAADAKVNLAVAAAEARKTADLVLNAAKRIASALRSFRRGRFSEVARHLNLKPGTVHRSWLEYKYGWMPILMDVKGAAEFCAQQSLPRATRFSVSATVTKTISRKFTTQTRGSPGPANNYDETETFSGEVTCRAKLWLELTSPTTRSASQLGLTNPALVAWELVPYSFVFDWFISVGDYLQARSALDGVTLKKAMRSTLKHGVYTYHLESIKSTGGGMTYYQGNRDYFHNIRDYDRSYLNVDTSSLYPPVNRGSLGFQKLLTSLALVRARTSS
jgi:hypothetical protein